MCVRYVPEVESAHPLSFNRPTAISKSSNRFVPSGRIKGKRNMSQQFINGKRNVIIACQYIIAWMSKLYIADNQNKFLSKLINHLFFDDPLFKMHFVVILSVSTMTVLFFHKCPQRRADKTRTVSDLTEWYPPLAILWCSNHIPSCTSAGSVLQLCKVSFKSNEPFRRSWAYKPISPYRTYFRV